MATKKVAKKAAAKPGGIFGKSYREDQTGTLFIKLSGTAPTSEGQKVPKQVSVKSEEVPLIISFGATPRVNRKIKVTKLIIED